MPEISVIVPVYNSKDTIVNCLNSICNQTYKNLEIIVVYLDSSDGTLDEIATVKDERIKIIEQKERTGPGGARNLGIDAAIGKWLGFVEADDVVLPDFYEKLFLQTTNKDADIICGEMISNGKSRENYKEEEIFKGFNDKYNLIHNGASFNKLFNTELIKKYNVRFAEGIRWEDNIFIFKSFYFAKAVRVTSAAKYFYNPSPWSEEYAVRLKGDVVPAAQEIINFAEFEHFSRQQTELLQKKIVHSFARSFILDEGVYNGLCLIMNKPLFLRVLFWKKRFKQWRRRLKHHFYRKENR